MLVMVQNAFEDWYIHNDLVDMNHVNEIKTDQSLDFHDIMNRLIY